MLQANLETYSLNHIMLSPIPKSGRLRSIDSTLTIIGKEVGLWQGGPGGGGRGAGRSGNVVTSDAEVLLKGVGNKLTELANSKADAAALNVLVARLVNVDKQLTTLRYKFFPLKSTL